MIKMPIEQALISKGMWAGIILMGIGGYVIIVDKDVTGGMVIMTAGLGILGIRDK